MTFQNVAIEGSKQYYNFLRSTGNDASSVAVLKISSSSNSSVFMLTLAQKLPTQDNLQIKVLNDVYDQNKVKILEYDKRRCTMKIAVIEELQPLFRSLCLEADGQKNIEVISDLKFLVERVKNWYEKYGEAVSLPFQKPSLSAASSSFILKPSEDQRKAIIGALSSPISYVWGAPGTGKTKFVLSQCLLSYFQEKRKVLITAPTNNAVEQMLYGVLEVFEKADVPYEGRLIRLGMASSEFAEKYPAVCEHNGKRLAELCKELSTLESAISKDEALLSRQKKQEALQNKVYAFNQRKVKLFDETDEITSLYKKEATVLAEIDFQRKQLPDEEKQLENKEKEILSIAHKIAEYSAEFDRRPQGLKGILLKPKYASLKRKLDETERMMHEYETAKRRLKDIIGRRKTKLNELKRSKDEINDTIGAKIQNLLDLAASYDGLSEELEQLFINQENPAQIHQAISNYEMTLNQQLKQANFTLQEPLEQIMLRLTENKNRKSEFQAEKEKLEKAENVHIENCIIIASTVDTCLNRLCPDDAICTFSHVFLDEAGYCSLAKAATLTAYHCPVTFLGDHMQLPPVCKMDRDDIKKTHEAAVWALSALYLENALFSPSDIANCYLTKMPAVFRKIKRFDLVHTYRFGEALAKILAENVYMREFYGNELHETDIYYIDAPAERGTEKRTNLSEVNAIKNYLLSHKENIGIITPYANQRKLLIKMTQEKRIREAGYSSEQVMTVHGSQGREWNTVILSVVDTDDKWFTNSSPHASSDGLKVINTAVSRAKRKLILVCDYQYWIGQENQLIGKLLQIARPVVL